MLFSEIVERLTKGLDPSRLSDVLKFDCGQDGVVTLGGDRVIIDRTAPTFDSLAMYSLEVANKTCQKRCTVRVAIDAAEELSSCTATIGGITANITGTGSERVAEAYIDENSGVAAGEITFSVISYISCSSQ